MLAERYPEDVERGNAMGIALGGLAMGVLSEFFLFIFFLFSLKNIKYFFKNFSWTSVWRICL